ncbi:MAG: YdeI/OmpD-associated family protein [Bacteroidota bacterium]
MIKKTDPRIDAYIEAAAPFAKPLLNHLRKLVHHACPEVEEKIKWRFPHFDYKGVYTSMAAFKEHCAFNFWKAKMMADPHGLLGEREERAMGHFGRIRSLNDLPPEEVLLEYLLEAKKLNDKGIKIAPKKPDEREKKGFIIPDDLSVALDNNAKARGIFQEFPYSYRKDYINWINEAKTRETRNKRITTTVEWTAEGKERNWKYKGK